MPVFFSNEFFAENQRGNIDFSAAGAVRVALMASGFTFDRDVHDDWANVSASEIAAGNGYTATGQLLDSPVVAVDDANDRSSAGYDDEVFTAAGGDFPAAAGAMFYDDSHATKQLIAYFQFVADETLTDGNTLTLGQLSFLNSQAP